MEKLKALEPLHFALHAQASKAQSHKTFCVLRCMQDFQNLQAFKTLVFRIA